MAQLNLNQSKPNRLMDLVSSKLTVMLISLMFILLGNTPKIFAQCNAPTFITCPLTIVQNPDYNSCYGTVNYDVEAIGDPVITYTYAMTGATVLSDVGTGSGLLLNIGTTHVEVTATNACGTSTCSFDVIINQPSPSISIFESSNNGCEGEEIFFFSSTNYAGTSPIYTWKKNGLPVGTNSDTYNDATLQTGDVITCELTSDMTCVQSSLAISNPVAMTFNTVPSFILNTPNLIQACAFDQIPLSITPSANTSGINWSTLFGGSFNNIGQANTVYTFSQDEISFGGAFVFVQVNNGACFSAPEQIIIGASPALLPAVTISETANNITPGTPVTFNTNSTNEGLSPLYNWFKNGNQVSTGTSYTDNSLQNGDLIYCELVSSEQCAQPQSVISNTIVMIVSNPNTSFSITDCQSNIIKGCDAVACGAIVNYDVQTNEPNNTSYSYTYSGAKNSSGTGLGSGTFFPVGTTHVVIVASNGISTDTCEFDITVNDDIAPTVSCKPAIIYLNQNGTASVSLNQINNGCSDNCGITSKTISKNNFGCADLGINQVTLTAIDIHGNVSTCTSNVLVKDNIKPVAKAKNITVYLNQNGLATLAPSQVDNGSYDNCSIVSMTLSKTTFQCNNKGNNQVIFTVKDAANNQKSCTINVNVKDTMKPVANCKNISITLNANGYQSIQAAQINDNSTDNCGIVSMQVYPSQFNCSKVGANNVTLKVKDASGNWSTCTAIVTVLPAAPSCNIVAVPIYNNNSNCSNNNFNNTIYLGYGPSSVKLIASNASCGSTTYSWSPATNLSCSNCKEPIFTPSAAGLYTFTCTVSNSAGVTSTCSISICVKNIAVPNSNKVYLCHNNQTIQVTPQSAAWYLNNYNNDELGMCGQSCGNGNRTIQTMENKPLSLDAMVFPNPSSDKFSLIVNTPDPEALDISIIDMQGRVVEKINKAEAYEKIEFGDKLPFGNYIVRIQSSTEVKTIKIIKSE